MMKITVTWYCACALCCGEWSPERGGPGLTKLGTRPREGVTIAAPRSVPLGSWVVLRLPGEQPRRFRVEDRTAEWAEGRWDIFVHSHRRAIRNGKRTARLEEK